MFSILKILRLSTGGNPLISEAAEVDFYTMADTLDLVEINMLGAFQVTDFYSGEEKSSGEFVEWVAKIIESNGLPESEVEIPIGVHNCTKDDWDHFFEPAVSA